MRAHSRFFVTVAQGALEQCLVGTSEIAVAAMHMGEILPTEKLPIKVVAFSHCFRREVRTAPLIRSILTSNAKMAKRQLKHPHTDRRAWVRDPRALPRAPVQQGTANSSVGPAGRHAPDGLKPHVLYKLGHPRVSRWSSLHLPRRTSRTPCSKRWSTCKRACSATWACTTSTQRESSLCTCVSDSDLC